MKQHPIERRVEVVFLELAYHGRLSEVIQPRSLENIEPTAYDAESSSVGTVVARKSFFQYTLSTGDEPATDELHQVIARRHQPPLSLQPRDHVAGFKEEQQVVDRHLRLDDQLQCGSGDQPNRISHSHTCRFGVDALDSDQRGIRVGILLAESGCAPSHAATRLLEL